MIQNGNANQHGTFVPSEGYMELIDFEKGIVNYGNWTRLHRVMNRAAAGATVTVGFIGGSITQGSLASAQDRCYACLVYQWWADKFPHVRYINAGIGGTTSQFGVARVGEDLLAERPDVVFIEFSVNDENNAHFQETYEGLVRTVLKSGSAAVLIHNVCYDTGISAEDMHLAVGKHYDLPCISTKPTIYPELVSGRIPNRQITPDDLHPNDAGHALVAGGIIFLLEKVLASKPCFAETQLPVPLTPNGYEHSRRYQNHNSSPIAEGFHPDHTPQTHITQMFRQGYTARNTGERITFLVEGTGIAVQYRKSVRKPAPIALATVDGREDTAVTLDANFQEDWGDCLYIDTLLTHGEDRLHAVTIEIIRSTPDDAVPFYLVSVIGSR